MTVINLQDEDYNETASKLQMPRNLNVDNTRTLQTKFQREINVDKNLSTANVNTSYNQ